MTPEQALAKLKQLVDDNLKAYKHEHITAEQLFKIIEEKLKED